MRLKLLIGTCLACIAASAVADDLEVTAEAAFIGHVSVQGVMPIAVTATNTGPDAKGEIEVRCSRSVMRYPIDLPRGSNKRILVYPIAGYYEDVQIQLNSNRGDVKTHMLPSGVNPGQGATILLIGDGQGDLGFLRAVNSGQSRTYQDVYVAPQLAPDRPLAYQGIAAVVLGSGAERLADGAVQALHLYALSGGTVCFLGGAAAPTVSDKRWEDLLPVTPSVPRSVSGSTLLNNLAGSDYKSSFTITSATAKDSSARYENGNLILAQKDFGLGKGVFMAFNPLEPPLSRYSARRRLFEKVLKPLESELASRYLDNFSNTESEYGTYGTAYPGTVGSPSGRYNFGDDPFAAKLPEAEQVFWILAAYFVVVVPINFLLLKKLKRGEIAWFTAPIISLGFAGVFFWSAKDLYTAGLSTATTGLLIVQEGSPHAEFVGSTQMFFPKGGDYDLKMRGVDSLGVTNNRYDYSFSGASSENADVNAIDVGEVLIPHMSVSNLDFRELAYTQLRPVQAEMFEVAVDRAVSSTALKITNRSGKKVSGCMAIVNGLAVPFGTLEAGKSGTVRIPSRITYTPDGDTHVGFGLSDFSGRTSRIIIKGQIEAGDIGPQIGTVVSSRQSINVAYFTNIHYGKVSL